VPMVERAQQAQPGLPAQQERVVAFFKA
jgi:hypothetical protein